jgi:hypothetical protein
LRRKSTSNRGLASASESTKKAVARKREAIANTIQKSDSTKKAVAKKSGEASPASSGGSSSRGSSTIKSASSGRRRTASGGNRSTTSDQTGNGNNSENMRTTSGDASQYEGSNISTGSHTPEGVTGSGMSEDDNLGGLTTDRDASGTRDVPKD